MNETGMTETSMSDQIQVGDQLPTREVRLTRADVVRYSGASTDFNPIHFSDRHARAIGLDGVIAHGMWTMGAAVQVVTDWVGDAGRIVDYGTRFTKPVVVPHGAGAEIAVAGVVKSLDEQTHEATVELTVTCGDDKVLGRCRAVARLD